MTDFFLPAYKFQQLLDYLEAIGVDLAAICAKDSVDYIALRDLDDRQSVPAAHYSSLYLSAASMMEAAHGTVPWAAGMGSSAFRLMCYAMVATDTLATALQRGEEFCCFATSLTGHSMRLKRDGDSWLLAYDFNTQAYRDAFAPQHWARSEHYTAVVLSSALRVWYSLAGWLIGRAVRLDRVHVAAPAVSDRYLAVLKKTFGCAIEFDSMDTYLSIPAVELQHLVVQDNDSLQHFLNYVLYQFWLEEQTPSTTSNAIKSFISKLPGGEMPNFDGIAERLHMSTSTLRRRLMSENTSYQQIKDECRKSMALEYLHQNELKIHEIGDRLGFAETSSFVRSFRKWTGMTPKAYRDSTTRPTRSLRSIEPVIANA